MKKTDSVSFDTVVEIGALLGGVTASASHRGVSLKLKGKILACTAIHSSAEPNSLMVACDCDARDRLIRKQPEIYYLTHHYRGYDTVLVRLPKMGRPELHKLLADAAKFVGAQNTAKKKTPKTANKNSKTSGLA